MDQLLELLIVLCTPEEERRSIGTDEILLCMICELAVPEERFNSDSLILLCVI